MSDDIVKRLNDPLPAWREAQAAEITRLRAELAAARREGMEEAAKRLEELHKNHKYNPLTGEGSEHDVGYYRALAEGAAHILCAAALDPDVSQSASNLVATARREGMEEVHALATLEVLAKKGKVEIARSLLGKGFEVGHLATNSVGVGKTVMDAIRAAAGEVK